MNNITKVFRVYFGYTFYVPVEYDVLIFFEPWKAYSGQISTTGKMRFRANYNKGLIAPNSTNSTIKIIPRIIVANNISNITTNVTINVTSPNASVIVNNDT